MSEALRRIRNAFARRAEEPSQHTEMTVQEHKNMSFEECQVVVSGFLDLAQHEIKWTTGLYTIAHSEVAADSLKRALGRVNRAQILIDQDADIEQARSDLPWLFDLNGKGVLELSRSTVPVPHWLVVDQKHVRLEMPHPINTWGRDNHVYKNANQSELSKIVRS